MNIHVDTSANGLETPAVKDTLARLHQAARGDAFIFPARLA